MSGNAWVDIEIGLKSGRVIMRQIKVLTYHSLRTWLETGKTRVFSFLAREDDVHVRDRFTVSRDSIEYIARDDD